MDADHSNEQWEMKSGSLKTTSVGAKLIFNVPANSPTDQAPEPENAPVSMRGIGRRKSTGRHSIASHDMTCEHGTGHVLTRFTMGTSITGPFRPNCTSQQRTKGIEAASRIANYPSMTPKHCISGLSLRLHHQCDGGYLVMTVA